MKLLKVVDQDTIDKIIKTHDWKTETMQDFMEKATKEALYQAKMF